MAQLRLREPIRPLRLLFAAGLLALVSLWASAPGVAAYGKADGPIAQIEFSANCNNPDFGLCQQVGLGGIWVWIEIDGGTGATSGEADVAGSGCGHVRGEGGGASSIRGEFDWWWSDMPEGLDVTFGAPTDPNGYYNVDLGGGFVLSFPVTTGHYSFHPVPAVAVETQVAP
jgi:hypothetical protein